MILLFNLNTYLGGGETLLVRLACHLHSRGDSYRILAMPGDCWIAAEAARLGLRVDLWPDSCDSINYLPDNQRMGLIGKIRDLYTGADEVRVFTFCMRDLHNAFYVFTRIQDLKTYFSHGIYHPEDVLYLSSYSLTPQKYVAFNQEIARRMVESGSVVFPNRRTYQLTVGDRYALGHGSGGRVPILPLPIPLPAELPDRRLPVEGTVRIICISRFVEFKVGAIIAIMRAIKRNPIYSLTIVGYGLWELVIRFWMIAFQMRNVSIIKGLKPSQLDDVIDQHHVGYAQGTALLEIAKRGLPVVVAPYSSIRDLVSRGFVTPGIFGEVDEEWELGDFYARSAPKSEAVSGAVSRLIGDYARVCELSKLAVKRYDADVVCENIFRFISSAEFNNAGWTFLTVSPPFFKRVFFSLVQRFRS